jgi:hypothetical protein
VSDSIKVLVDIEIRIERKGWRQPDVSPQQRLYLPHAFGKRIAGKKKFHPVASGKKNHLFDLLQMREHMQRVYLFLACHRELLPYFQGSRLVTHA